MTKPRLGRRHQPPGHFSSVIPGELADRVSRTRVPGEYNRSGRQVVLAGNVEERRQQRPLPHRAGGHELGSCKRLEAQVPDLRTVLKVDVSQGAIGGAEVDADEEAGHAGSGIRAGDNDTGADAPTSIL